MATHVKCWLYQCHNPECLFAGIINEVVMQHSYPAGALPCPQCGQEMTRMREARPGEYDPETEDAKAAWEIALRNVRLATPAEAAVYLNPGAYLASNVTLHNAPVARGTRGDKPSADAETPALLNADETAERLGTSRQNVYRLWREKKLGYVQVNGKQRKCTLKHIEDFIEGQSLGIKTVAADSNPVHSTNPRVAVPKRHVSIDEVRQWIAKW